MLSVGQFVCLPHVDVGLSVYVVPRGTVGWSACFSSSLYCGLLSLCLFLTLLWVGQFIFLPQGAVGCQFIVVLRGTFG